MARESLPGPLCWLFGVIPPTTLEKGRKSHRWDVIHKLGGGFMRCQRERERERADISYESQMTCELWAIRSEGPVLNPQNHVALYW